MCGAALYQYPMYAPPTLTLTIEMSTSASCNAVNKILNIYHNAPPDLTFNCSGFSTISIEWSCSRKQNTDIIRTILRKLMGNIINVHDSHTPAHLRLRSEPNCIERRNPILKPYWVAMILFYSTLDHCSGIWILGWQLFQSWPFSPNLFLSACWCYASPMPCFMTHMSVMT